MATRDGRALPPRPSLMAGDEAQCRAIWAKLCPVAHEAVDRVATAKKEAGLARLRQPVEDLGHIVAQFRSLRESLVSNQIADSFAVQVYEMSADVCAAARNYPELLKCIQTLVNELYPAQQLQQKGCADEAWGDDDVQDDAPAVCCARQPEMCAAQLLFFACIPAVPNHLDIIMVMKSRQLKEHWMSAEVQYAISVARMVNSADYLGVLIFAEKFTTAPTPLLQTLTDALAIKVQHHAARVASTAYLSLSVQGACELILGVPLKQATQDGGSGEEHGANNDASLAGGGLRDPEALTSVLHQVLVESSEAGCRGATIAVASWEQIAPSGFAGVLPFRQPKT